MSVSFTDIILIRTSEKKRLGNLKLGVIFLILLLNIFHLPVLAQNAVPDTLIKERLQYLKNSIEQDKKSTNLWWYGWLTTYCAATVGQGVVYFTTDEKSLRQDMALGAVTTLLGAAGQFISPLIPSNKQSNYNSFLENTLDEQLIKISYSEILLQKYAKQEELARSWQNHALTGAVNLGGGIITWLGFKRSVWAGIGNFALNTVITEAQIWTSPSLAKRNYNNYCRKYLTDKQTTSFTPKVNLYFTSYFGGAGFKVVF